MRVALWLTESARKDLDEIQAYCLSLSPEASSRVRQKFAETFDRLRRQPNLGHRRTDLVGGPYLIYRVFSYLLIYKVEHGRLTVARVIHAARNVQALLEAHDATEE